MKSMKWIALVGMAAVGALAWQIGERLSSDAISMGLGVFFGILAGIPAALLVMASNRRDDRPAQPQSQQHQPPVIILTGSHPQALPDQRHYFVPPQAENFYDIEPAHSREIVRRGGRQ